MATKQKQEGFNVEMWNVDQLIPYANNAKSHPPEQVKKIARQLGEFGWDQPIVVDEGGVILKGHGRRLGAILNGYKEVPVYQRIGLTEAQKIALRLGDNKSAESEWLDDELWQEFKRLELLGVNDMSGTAFSADEIDGILQDIQTGDPQRENGGAGNPPAAPPSGLQSTYTPAEGDGDDSGGGDGFSDAPPASNVRMMQLFLNTDTFPQVMKWIEFLNGEFSTSNPTDCVFKALKECAEEREKIEAE